MDNFINELIEQRNYATDRGTAYAQGVAHYSGLSARLVEENGELKQRLLDIEEERRLQSLNPEVLAQLMQHARETSKIEELRSWDKRLSKIDIPLYTTDDYSSRTSMSDPTTITYTTTSGPTSETSETFDTTSTNGSTLTSPTTNPDNQSDNNTTVKPRRIRKSAK